MNVLFLKLCQRKLLHIRFLKLLCVFLKMSKTHNQNKITNYILQKVDDQITNNNN